MGEELVVHGRTDDNETVVLSSDKNKQNDRELIDCVSMTLRFAFLLILYIIFFYLEHIALPEHLYFMFVNVEWLFIINTCKGLIGCVYIFFFCFCFEYKLLIFFLQISILYFDFYLYCATLSLSLFIIYLSE